MLFSFKNVPLHSNEQFNANRSYIAMQAQVGHMRNSCFIQALSVQNAEWPQISKCRVRPHIQVCEWRTWLTHIPLEKFPIVFFSLRYWMGQYLSSCSKHFSHPPKHFDCLLYWLKLHNSTFQMVSFSLASYNFRKSPPLPTPCPYVYGFYFYFSLSSVFLLLFHPTCFKFV